LRIYVEFEERRRAIYDDRRRDLGSKLFGALESPSIQHLQQDVMLVGSQRTGDRFSLRHDGDQQTERLRGTFPNTGARESG
jgi:hypothetical protein